MNITSLADWIENQMIRGHYIFTKEDVMNLTLLTNNESLQKSLYRLQVKGVIVTPWHNFYVAVPMEYRLKGEVPPSFYINQLMNFLSREYYVSHLSAATFNGAGHQRAMVFQVTTNGKTLVSKMESGMRLNFFSRKQIPTAYINKVKVQTGFMNVSSVELTALDIVSQEEKIGGLSRAAEILVELSENMSWDKEKLNLLVFFSSAIIQRLGFLLSIIGEEKLADDLKCLLTQTGKSIRKVKLKQSKPATENMEIDRKWKVIINQTIEIDEI